MKNNGIDEAVLDKVAEFMVLSKKLPDSTLKSVENYLYSCVENNVRYSLRGYLEYMKALTEEINRQKFQEEERIKEYGEKLKQQSGQNRHY